MQRLSQVFDKYLFWGVVVLFVFIPLYPKFPILNVPGTYVAIRLEDFLIALLILGWFLAILPKFKQFLQSTLTQTFLLFWLITFFSLISGIFLTQTVVPHLGFLHYLRRVELMLLFFVSLQAVKTLKEVKILLVVMLATTLVIVLYGFGQQFLAFPVISTTNREYSKGLILTLSGGARVNSTFAGHYDLAAYLAMFLTLASAMFLYHRQIRKKVLIIGISAISFILLSMTAARVSFFAALLGIACAIWLCGPKKLLLVLVALLVFAFIISPQLRNRTLDTITVNLLNQDVERYSPPPQNPNPSGAFSLENAATGSATPSGVPRDIAPGEPLNTTQLGVYRSFGIRFNDEWPRALRAFYKNPLFGTGYSSLTIAVDNDYLRSLGETGLLGTLSLSLIFFFLIKNMWRFLSTRKKDFSFYLMAGLLSMILALLANASFIDVLESSKIESLFWMILGVGAGILKLPKEDEET